MKKRMSTQTKALVKSIIMVFILLSALIFSLTTFGWFSKNRVINADSIKLTVEPASKIEISKSFILKRTGSGHALDVTDQQNLSLGEYDSTMDSRGVTNPIVIFTELIIPKVNGRYISFLSSLYCRNTDQWKSTNSGHEYLTNYLSNLIQVRCNYCDEYLNELISEVDLEITYQRASLIFDPNAIYYTFNSLTMDYERVNTPNPANLSSYYVKRLNRSEEADYDALYEGAIEYLADEEKKNFITYTSSPSISLTSKDYSITNGFNVNDFEHLVDSANKLYVVFEIDYDPEIMEIFTSLWQYSGNTTESALNIFGDLSHLIFKDGDYSA